MFTGIVEELGAVVALSQWDDGARLTLRGPRVSSDLHVGDSIAVNGCCLTVATRTGATFSADVMPETLGRTALGDLSAGSPVNLERAVSPQGRLGGHIVQGHVDATGTLIERTAAGGFEVARFAVSAGLIRYLVPKGSVAVDGISLTIVDVNDGTEPSFTVALIPTTLSSTTLGTARSGARVNLEADILAKYVERLLTSPSTATEGRR